MAGEAILIVDDNPANAKLARVVLTNAGSEVRTAVDAEEALVAVDSFQPRMILTVVVAMTGCDGYLTKPIDTRTFASVVAGHIAGPRVRAP
jgi:PleD family two-component response regulator